MSEKIKQLTNEGYKIDKALFNVIRMKKNNTYVIISQLENVVSINKIEL